MKRLVAAAALSAALMAPAPAHAIAGHHSATRGPITCTPGGWCHQDKTVTITRPHQSTVVLTFRHRRPEESRSAWLTPPWTPWRLVGAVLVVPR